MQSSGYHGGRAGLFFARTAEDVVSLLRVFETTESLQNNIVSKISLLSVFMLVHLKR